MSANPPIDEMSKRGWVTHCKRCRRNTDIVDAAQFRLSYLESPDDPAARTTVLAGTLCLDCRKELVEFVEKKR